MPAGTATRLKHDLRTVLGVVMGNAELLQESQLTPSQQNYVDRILAASRTMLEILEGRLVDPPAER